MLTDVAAPAHFALDIDPGKLRVAARKLKDLAEEFAERGGKVAGTPGGIGSSWTGAAALSVKQEMRGLGDHLVDFADDLDRTRRAVVRLAEQYDRALEEVDSLNAQWRAADDDHDAAVGKADRNYDKAHPVIVVPKVLDLDHLAATGRSDDDREAERRRLNRLFDDLEGDVRRHTRQCAQSLAEGVPLPVTAEEVTLYRAFGVHGLEVQRNEFNRQLPLSGEVDRRALEEVRIPTDDGYTLSSPNGWNAATFAEYWRSLSAKRREALITDLNQNSAELRGRAGAALPRHHQYLRDLNPANRHAFEEFLTMSRRADGLDRQAAQLGSKFFRTTPLIGWAVTAGGVGYEINKGVPVDKAVLAGAAGVAAGAAFVIFAPATVPVAVVAVGAALAGFAATELTNAAWESEVGQDIREGTKDVGKAMGNGAKSAWKGLFG